MTVLHYEALLPINAKQWFVERDTAAYLSLQSRMLNLGRQEFVESWKQGDVAFVKMVTKPNPGAWLPGSAQKSLVKDDQLEMVDTIAFEGQQLDRGPPYVLPVKSEIPVLGGKTDIHFKITIVDAGPNKTKQILDGSATIKIFGLGKLAEKMLKRSMKQTYEKLPEVVQKWQMHRNDIARGPGGEARLLAGRPSVLQESQSQQQHQHHHQQSASMNDRGSTGGDSAQQAVSSSEREAGQSKLHPAPTAYFSAASSQEDGEDLRDHRDHGQMQIPDVEREKEMPPTYGMLGERLQSLQSFNEEAPEWAKYWSDLGITSTENVYVQRFGRVIKVTRRLGLGEGDQKQTRSKTTNFYSLFPCCNPGK